MYFSFTRQKLVLFAGLISVILFAVYLTFSFKLQLFGESSFSQILVRTSSDFYKTLVYSLQENGGRLAGIFSQSNTYVSSSEIKEDPRNARAIPILTYHAIITSKDKENQSPESFEGHNIGLKEFEDQMFTLKNNGWETITLIELHAFMREGKELPEKSFLLTFDDGAKESYYPVEPLLKVLGYEAVTFILPSFSEGNGTHYYLSENEIARAIKSGRWEVGSHGNNVHNFVSIDNASATAPALANRKWLSEKDRVETLDEYENRIREDLLISQKKLEEMFNVPIKTFAFPFGDFGQLSKNIPVEDMALPALTTDIYDYAFYQWWQGEGFTYNYREPYKGMMKRISVKPTWSGADLLTMLENGKPKALPYLDTFEENRGWLSTWGNYAIADSRLSMRAEETSNGASVLLDGTKDWKNYTLHLDIAKAEQTGVFVYIRYQDTENFASCNIGNGFAHVEQTVQGKQQVIKGNRSDTIFIPQGPFRVDIEVQDRHVSCGINGEVLVDTEFLDEILNYGGIGLKIWDKDAGKSNLDIDTINITDSNVFLQR